MGILGTPEDLQQTRDSVSSEPPTQPIYKIKNEKVLVEEASSKTTKDTIGHSFIMGHSVNGVLGTANGDDGQQIILGEAGRATTLLRVINPDSIYRERFRWSTFKDSTVPNTANWDTTTGQLAMSDSGNHATIYNTISQSAEIAYNDGTISQATLQAIETKWNPGDSIQYFLSADGGSNWEEVTRNTRHTFTVTGTDLRFKVIFTGNGGKDTYIENLRVDYS